MTISLLLAPFRCLHQETESHRESKNQQGEDIDGKLEEIINNIANPEEGSADEDEVEADDQVKVEENEVSPEEPVPRRLDYDGGSKTSCGSSMTQLTGLKL
ncbi:hypothetical protein SADUNF_Sadunf06G0219200 [Salix dunnii]|uniref:Uncharacterized protein n=1 Tax=Salix dunnii TaxID=1413687 RepID=A0A835KAL0_9ROSI|nr:hypothetical protein SADUNF_Sadunf06G0219200 [Salix dunnii]